LRRLIAPDLVLDAAKISSFERALASAAPGGSIEYRLSHPKHEFLSYLIARHDVVLHGSGNSAVDVFTPTVQTDYFGHVRKAVFAASDGIWPMFFAVLDRSSYHGSLRNACYWDVDAGGRRQKCYAFSINASFLAREPWAEGCIYVLPRAPFERVVDEDGSPSEEWLSTREVRPIARLAVSPSDFPFLKDVEGHGDGRSDRFEELVYQLAVGAEELSTREGSLGLAFRRPGDWRERIAEFVALMSTLLPGVDSEMQDAQSGLDLRLSGSGPNYDRIAVALQQWRRAISAE
jgi:hypothetical protein